MPLKTILKYFLFWRTLIFLVAVLAIFILKPSITFTHLTPKASTSDLLNMWSNFDGLHYQNIAKFGYGALTKTDKVYAFFPVYPWLIKQINPLIGNFTASGLIVSSISLIFALFFLYKLIKLDYSAKIAKHVLFLTLIFPTSFYFGSVYNESTFLLLAVLSFYFARKNNFPFACITAAILSATRVTGIFIWVALIIEYFSSSGEGIKSFIKPKILWLLTPPIGLLTYMYYQFRMTGDALLFINFQRYVPGRTTDKLVLLYQVFFRYIKMILTVAPWSSTYFSVILEFIIGFLFLILLILSIKKIRLSYWVFCALSYILPTLTGTLSSFPRYALVLFPMFIFLATWLDKRHPFVRYLYYAFCIIFSLLSIGFFTRGYFIG